jgi:hypothetical protein
MKIKIRRSGGVDVVEISAQEIVDELKTDLTALCALAEALRSTSIFDER